MPRITSDEIEVLDSLEAIRRRPSTYLGNPSQPETLTCYVVQALCLAADELASGTATYANVTLRADSIVVEDDGPGLSLERDRWGVPHAEKIVSALMGCRLEKANPGVGHAFCGVGIVATNALSSHFEVQIARDGELWAQGPSGNRRTAAVRVAPG